MKNTNWEIIAKNLAGETTKEEDAMITKMRNEDLKFDLAYLDSKKIWNTLNKPKYSFNKKRIVFIRDQKIKQAKSQYAKRFIAKAIQYAAVVVGLLVAVLFTYNDLNSEVVYTTDNSKNVVLPDGSTIILNNDAIISYNNSLIMGFQRRVKIIEGSAYFSIAKQQGENFVVNTENYDIEVFGTKFNVSNDDDITTVTLDEGKVRLCEYSAVGIDNITMLPGDEVSYGVHMPQPVLCKVNSNVSKYWMKSRLEFDQYSIEDLKEIFKKYYNKELILDGTDIQMSKVGGSAPTDDVELIVKALSKIFKRELIIRKDSIILK